jgi:hypothetical protein
MEILHVLFQHPNSALAIAGKDGITTDVHGFARFLASQTYSVGLFFLENSRLLLQTSSTTLLVELQGSITRIQEIQQRHREHEELQDVIEDLEQHLGEEYPYYIILYAGYISGS